MTNALSSSIQFFSNFFKCADSSVVQPKSQSKHFFKSIHRSVKRVQYPADQGALADMAFSNDQRVHYLKNAFVVRVAYCSSVRVTP